MARRSSRALSRLVAVPAACGLLLGMGLVAGPAAAQPPDGGPVDSGGSAPVAVETLPDSDTGLYVVRFAEPALASYAGGVPGLAATSPSVTGEERLDPEAPASVAYLEHLAANHDTFESRMEQELDRAVEVEFAYRNVLNGMAVAVGATEAARLATLPGVAEVFPDREHELTTDVSNDLIGSAGFWEGATGPGLSTQGEGVIVGMVDTGVNGNHPSFATVDGDGYVHENPLGTGNYLGVCDPAHPAHEAICTEKLIGAYNLNPDSPSAQDWNDHGSHVGSTIAGNRHEATFPVGTDTYTRTVQGVAPRANVISYLVCFPGCPSTSSVAAVDQAIADGVDVLNYSISGSDDPWNDPVDLAFLDAYEAGVYVSASAGNDGPGASTVAKTGPWNASVAATTHQRVFAHVVDVTGPAPVPSGLTGLPGFPGGDGVPVTADIEAEVGFEAANPTGCEEFPAGAFAGQIALVQRGGCTFPVKVDNAAAAGAIAVLIFNNVAGPPTAPGGLAEATVPALMIEQAAGEALRDLVLGTSDPVTALINVDTEMFLDPTWEDLVAGFSSRGPSQFDLLAPTFAAPGVNILAAAHETPAGADNYTIIGGTSMASPHGAGAAALLVALHPDWSPARVRSALAGTADADVLRKEDGVTPADPFDQGSGRLDLAAAARVGLVLDETSENFAAADPAIGGDPRALNVPHLVDQNCVPSCEFSRTFTSVADAAASYTAQADAPAGVTVEVSPAAFTVAPGESVTLTVAITASGISAGDWRFADITLQTSGQHAGGEPIAGVHFPVVVGAQPPSLTLEPEEIASVQGPDEVVTETLTIGNSGGEPLTWELVESPGTVTVAENAPAENSLAADPDQTLDAINLWDQPVNGTSGIVSDFYNAHGTGVYAADDFTLSGEVSVEVIHTGGFWNASDLPDATALTWYVYPDDGGTPAGHPEDGLDAHVWTFTTTPTGAGVDVTDDNVTLDVVAATGEPLVLDGGTYWLSVFPDIDGPCCAGETRWNWRQGTPQQEQAHLVDPGDLFGGGFTDWTSFGALGLSFTNTAFRLEGTVACAPGDVPWLDAAPASGSVAPGGADEVDVTIDSTGLTAGVHQASLCLTTNDPSREVTVIPVTLEVEAAAEVPAIEVTPDAIEAEVVSGESTSETLTIDNVGDGALDWSVAVAETGTEADPGAAAGAEAPGGQFGVGAAVGQGFAAIGAGVLAASGGAPLTATEAVAGAPEDATPEDAILADLVLWDQPLAGTNGIVSDFYTALGGGVYAADEFVLAEPASVELIHADGFWNVGSLAEATALNWYVYPDAGGVPAGQPEDGLDAHVWTFSTPPTGPGVDITDNNITLDVLAATGAGIPLAAGTYWLTVFPDIPALSLDGATRWNWSEATAAGTEAHLIDPTDLFGAGISAWTPFSVVGLAFGGTAFRLEGSEGAVGCTPGDVPWLSAAPTSGSTPAGGSDEVTLTFDAAGLAVGEHSAVVCVESNDPATPLVEVPVTLTVAEEPPPGGDPVCDRTIMGVHSGPLTVDEGVTCLAAGSRVAGEVNVAPGAGLIAVAAVVQGPLSASGATVVDIAFSQVTGPVSITGSTGAVSLFGSQVTGSVVLAGNATGDDPAVVAGNTVIGSLSCLGNTPPPTNHGLANTVVGGVKIGQCATL